jgi:hypothetical protein
MGIGSCATLPLASQTRQSVTRSRSERLTVTKATTSRISNTATTVLSVRHAEVSSHVLLFARVGGAPRRSFAGPRRARRGNRPPRVEIVEVHHRGGGGMHLQDGFTRITPLSQGGEAEVVNSYARKRNALRALGGGNLRRLESSASAPRSMPPPRSLWPAVTPRNRSILNTSHPVHTFCRTKSCRRGLLQAARVLFRSLTSGSTLSQ